MSELVRTFAPHSDETGQRAIETLTSRDNTSVVAGRSYMWSKGRAVAIRPLAFFFKLLLTTQSEEKGLIGQ